MAEKGSCSLPAAEVVGAFHQDAHAVHSHDSHHQQAQRTQLQGKRGGRLHSDGQRQSCNTAFTSRQNPTGLMSQTTTGG